MALHDEATKIEEAMEEGYEQGREEGREQGREEGRKEGEEQAKIETAKNLLKLGVAIDIIVKSTNLSEEKINSIKNEI